MREAEAFEQVLRDNRDDLAGWCAYADYLGEQGDPRAAFMQTQIALEEMTPEAIAARAATGVILVADKQHGEHPSRIDPNVGYLDYLSYGDME